MGSVTAARVAAPTLLDVIPSFERHLRAENKAARTIQSYTEAVRRLHDFCSANGMPLEVKAITSEHIEAFLADQLARLRPTSARARFASLRQFFAWLASRDEREIERRIVKADPGVGIPWNYEGAGSGRQSACARPSTSASPSPTTVFGLTRSIRRPHVISGSASTSRRPIPP